MGVYVDRDDGGRIVARFALQQHEGQEFLEVDIDKLRADKLTAIEAEFQARISAGMPFNGKTVQIREADRNVISAVFGRAVAFARQEAEPIPGVTITWPEDGYPWRMADDSYLLLSAPEFVDMAQQVADFYGALFYASRALKDAAAEASTAEALAAIDITSGLGSGDQ